MQCKVCGSDKLVANVTVTAEVPLAARSGSVKFGGFKFTNLEFKTTWDEQRPLRGPIFCSECASEHYLDTRVYEGLILGSIEQARSNLALSGGR
jgi:hypothetical protein